MSFQSSVFINMGFGVPGELFTDSPYTAAPFTINSSSAAYNIIGATCATITSQGFCQAGAAAVTLTGTLASSTAVTALSSTAALLAGFFVTGTGIPAGTTIASITNATSLVLSAAATVSATESLVFTPPNLGFAGFLVNPLSQALFGTGGQPLAPTLTINNYSIVPCLTMGVIVVTLPAAANIGDNVIYNQTTGAISTIAPGVLVPFGYTFANAIVSYFTQDIAGSALAVVTVNPTFLIPTHA